VLARACTVTVQVRGQARWAELGLTCANFSRGGIKKLTYFAAQGEIPRAGRAADVR
jgi:hypothetical protein